MTPINEKCTSEQSVARSGGSGRTMSSKFVQNSNSESAKFKRSECSESHNVTHVTDRDPMSDTVP